MDLDEGKGGQRTPIEIGQNCPCPPENRVCLALPTARSRHPFHCQTCGPGTVLVRNGEESRNQGVYRPPVLSPMLPLNPPQTTIRVPVQRAV